MCECVRACARPTGSVCSVIQVMQSNQRTGGANGRRRLVIHLPLPATSFSPSSLIDRRGRARRRVVFAGHARRAGDKTLWWWRVGGWLVRQRWGAERSSHRKHMGRSGRPAATKTRFKPDSDLGKKKSTEAETRNDEGLREDEGVIQDAHTAPSN